MKLDMEQPWIQVIIIIILFLIIYFGFIRKKVLESFDVESPKKEAVISVQDSEDIGNDLKKNATKIEDSLHLDKYRTQMEHLIIDMNDWISAKTAESLPAIAKKINESSSIDDVIKEITQLNELNNFKLTLNGAMKFIDSK